MNDFKLVTKDKSLMENKDVSDWLKKCKEQIVRDEIYKKYMKKLNEPSELLASIPWDK